MNRGDDAAPYTREELRGKFEMLVGRVWAPAHAAKLLDATLSMAREGRGSIPGSNCCGRPLVC